MSSNSTGDLRGTRVLTITLIYSSFSGSSGPFSPGFFLPLRDLVAISSRPKMASHARETAISLRLAVFVLGNSLRTYSTGRSFSGVIKGGGGISAAARSPFCYSDLAAIQLGPADSIPDAEP